jgi:hypothetical protein
MDTGRAGEAVSPPTLLWSALGIVKANPVVDPAEGVFVLVRVMPEDFTVSCRVAVTYSGDGFGMYFPLRVGEQVAIAFPGGETFGNPYIVARIPSREEKPPTEFDNEVVIVKMKTGESIRVLTGGGGEIRLGGGQNEASAVRWSDLNQALQQYHAQTYAPHTHLDPVSGSTGVPSVLTPPNIAAAASASVKVD